jgi:3-deoxy-D-manno-octulosonic-acid transferase
MFLVYQLVAALLALLALPFFAFHPRLRTNLKERLGWMPASLTRPRGAEDSGTPLRIWLHGASAGDLVTLVPLALSLKKEAEEPFILASALTATGIKMARDRQEIFDAVVSQPLDAWGAPLRAMRHLRPDVLVLEYAELWPGLIRAARRVGARVVLANGRIAPRSVPRYRLLSRLIGGLLENLDLCLMRNAEEAERAVAAGARVDRVRVTGNTKFDALSGPAPLEAIAELRAHFAITDADLIWTCGSTHEGEEAILLDVFEKMRAHHPRLRLLLAPRYPERGPKVVALAQARAFSTHMRSREKAGAGAAPEKADVMVLDTMGELKPAYALADVVFVGGSMVPRGGQNILEPAAESRPVLFGPLMEAQKDLVEVLQGRGGIQVRDPVHLTKVLEGLLGHDEERQNLGRMAARTVAEIRGASLKNAHAILSLLGEKAS